ncbi:hypothetical protein ACJMK2_007175 [Sinanodonta woodiana]|uniref:Kyphoscoliosis peptidase n=1 Tax=Sinanodonta woodiana TaxID=1069815 RepID=A0ABD3VKN8_SINWO
MGSAPSSFDQQVAPTPNRLYATYQLLPSFVYSEKLKCYVDNEPTEDEEALVPEPHPPPTRKEEIFDVQRFADVDARALKAPSKLLKEPLKALVNYLIEGYTDDLSKIRVIYRWITNQSIDTIKFPKSEPSPTQSQYQLWRIKEKKGNYAQLVSLLCRFAHIPCVIIHGKLKGTTYNVGDQLDGETHYGEWNAVLINNHWRFINAYWGTCAEGMEEAQEWISMEQSFPDGLESDSSEAGGKMVYHCDENYFLTDPDQMVSSHLPDVPEWQLKTEVMSQQDFEEMVFLKDRFFNLKMKTISHDKCHIYSENGELEIRFGVPKEISINADFQYLLFRLKNGEDKSTVRYDRFVFLHREHNMEVLVARIRSPVADTFKFELVGKDRSIKSPMYDYDWVALYKIIFKQAKDGREGCQPYPETPEIGWGPGKDLLEIGMAPMSHCTGEVKTDENGMAEIKFSQISTGGLSDLAYSAKLYTGGVKQTEIPDRVVHRVENGDVIFNVRAPWREEYALHLFCSKPDEKNGPQNICNYLVVSSQKHHNGSYPKGFQDKLGPSKTFNEFGITPSHVSGMIYTEVEEVTLSFQKTKNIDLSINLSGGEIKQTDAHRLITRQDTDTEIIIKVRLPSPNSYGLKIRGTATPNSPHEDIYSYIIEYRRQSGKKKRKEKEEEKLEQTDLSGVPEILRRKIQQAIADHNIEDLESAIWELKGLNLPNGQEAIDNAEGELHFLKVRRELIEATDEKNYDRLTATIDEVKKKRYEHRLPRELANAMAILDRLKTIQRLLHAIMALDQRTIAEIRGYQSPPPAVHSVMKATLLLLGHFEEETEEWKNVQIALGKTGKESIKRQIGEFKLESIPLDIALGARDLIREFTLEQVRLVSAGAATFYVWVHGMAEEIEKRAGEEQVGNARPRTRQRRKRE